MPWIHMSTTVKMTPEEKRELADEIGYLVEIIKGKFHRKTMVRIDDDVDIYRGGERVPCAFMETRIMIPNDWDQQVEYTAKCYELFQKKLGLEPWQVYFNVLEIPTFGSRGSLHKPGE